jgi:hypothetical protein
MHALRPGLSSAALVLATSLAVILLSEVDTFTGVIAYVAMCCTPALVVINVHGTHDLPPALAQLPRWARGSILSGIILAVGSVAAGLLDATVGGGRGPHFPPLVMFAILVIVTTFWLAIVLGGWPFTLLKNRVAALGALLLACYAIAYVLFRLLFNFSFLQSAPIYVAGLDPGGAFNAWYALIFLITCITGLFLVRSFDFWLFSGTTQPVRGLIWTVVCLVWGTALFSTAVGVLDADVVAFLVWVPIPFLFGSIIVHNVLHGALFERFSQPFEGVLNVVTSVAIGTALMLVFRVLSPLSGEILAAGAPAYQLEIWLANATLGLTFPLLVCHAELFQFWPFTAERRRVPP